MPDNWLKYPTPSSGPPASPVPNIMDILDRLDANTKAMAALIGVLTPKEPTPDTVKPTGYEDVSNELLLDSVTSRRNTFMYGELDLMHREILYRMEHGCK